MSNTEIYLLNTLFKLICANIVLKDGGLFTYNCIVVFCMCKKILSQLGHEVGGIAVMTMSSSLTSVVMSESMSANAPLLMHCMTLYGISSQIDSNSSLNVEVHLLDQK